MLLPNELEIMELLWSKDRPLSRGEIINSLPYKSWKSSTIHLLLNDLLKKGMIKVDNFKKTGKNYGRTFSVVVTREEYTRQELVERLTEPDLIPYFNLTGVFSSFVGYNKVDDEVLENIQRILDEQKDGIEE